MSGVLMGWTRVKSTNNAANFHKRRKGNRNQRCVIPFAYLQNRQPATQWRRASGGGFTALHPQSLTISALTHFFSPLYRWHTSLLKTETSTCEE